MIHAFVQFFMSLPGVFALAALDSTFFFTLPLGIDAVVVIMAARRGIFFWFTPILATIGSLETVADVSMLLRRAAAPAEAAR